MIINGQIDYENSHLSNISTQCLDLLKKLLEVNPIKRISAKDALDHEWFDERKKPLLSPNIKYSASA
jgi:calcium-dependent protein kinase